MLNFNIDSAVKHLVDNSHEKTQGLCAKYVANALNAGNLTFARQPSAYLYHTKGILKSIGFTQISKPNPPQKGDVYVQNCTDSHPDGHMAMYSGTQWISDFRQKSDQVYSSDAGEIYYYRYNGSISSSNKKSINEIAKEVINGLWGNGPERRMKLENAGYNYKDVQNEVNNLLK